MNCLIGLRQPPFPARCPTIAVINAIVHQARRYLGAPPTTITPPGAAPAGGAPPGEAPTIITPPVEAPAGGAPPVTITLLGLVVKELVELSIPPTELVPSCPPGGLPLKAAEGRKPGGAPPVTMALDNWPPMAFCPFNAPPIGPGKNVPPRGPRPKNPLNAVGLAPLKDPVGCAPLSNDGVMVPPMGTTGCGVGATTIVAATGGGTARFDGATGWLVAATRGAAGGAAGGVATATPTSNPNTPTAANICWKRKVFIVLH
jgi:hypothetical protein